jgi:Fe-S cluster assembly iron-binding protein IscA
MLSPQAIGPRSARPDDTVRWADRMDGDLCRDSRFETVEASCRLSEREPVLTLTDNASNIVKAIVEQNGGSHDAGLRFSAEPAEGAQAGALAVTTVDAAQPGDQVVDKDGAKVYLEETAAVALGDQVLDASVDQAGAVQFSIAPSA